MAIVTPVAATIATQAGFQPARISGTTILTMTASVSPRAISERTPRHPPTTVTATANSPSNSPSTGTRYRSATETNVESGSSEALDHDLVADVVARQVLLSGRALERAVDRLPSLRPGQDLDLDVRRRDVVAGREEGHDPAAQELDRGRPGRWRRQVRHDQADHQEQQEPAGKGARIAPQAGEGHLRVGRILGGIGVRGGARARVGRVARRPVQREDSPSSPLKRRFPRARPPRPVP